jgi:hypothetical protein
LKKGKTTGGNSVPRPAPGDQQGLKLDLQGREAGGSVGLLLPPLGGPAHALIGLLWGFPCTRVRKYKAGRLRLSKQISCQRLLTVAAVPLWRLRRSAHGCRIGQKTRKNDSAWSLGGGKLHKYQGIPWKPFFPCISASRVQVALRSKATIGSVLFVWPSGFHILKAGLKVHTNRVLVYLVSSSTLRLLSIDAEDTIFSGHIVAATG